MRRYFANWAAHNSADMDYLTRDQWERGLLEITLAGDWGYYRHDSVTHNLHSAVTPSHVTVFLSAKQTCKSLCYASVCPSVH